MRRTPAFTISATTTSQRSSSCGSFQSKLTMQLPVSTISLTSSSGAWIVFPTYMIYVFGKEILDGIDAATGVAQKKAQ